MIEFKPTLKTAFRREVDEDGWVYKINNKTKERTRTNTRVVYGESKSKPLMLGINHVKRLARSKPELSKSARSKMIRGYKDEAWRTLADYRAGLHRQNKVSKLPGSKKRAKAPKKNRPRFERGA